LTKGDRLVIGFGEQKYELEVKELRPENAVSIADVDVNVDFFEPKDAKHAKVMSTDEQEVKVVVATPTTTSQGTLIKQGAEARLFKIEFLGRWAIVKERFRKGYRHPDLDTKLRNSRTQSEVRTLMKVRQLGIDTPLIYYVDQVNCSIYLEWVRGPTVKEFLDLLDLTQPTEEAKAVAVVRDVARVLATLHEGDMVHGDLTTSNMILRQKEGAPSPEEYMCVCLIDFGLSYRSTMIEDKAVDLYVLEKAFLATHARSDAVWQKLLETYHSVHKDSSKILQKLHEVRKRGRKRTAFG